MDLGYRCMSIGKKTTTRYIVNFHKMLYWIENVAKTHNGLLMDKVQKEGEMDFINLDT